MDSITYNYMIKDSESFGIEKPVATLGDASSAVTDDTDTWAYRLSEVDREALWQWSLSDAGI